MATPPTWARRLVGAALAVALHVAFIFLFLQASLGPRQIVIAPRETMIVLRPLKIKREKPAQLQPRPTRKAPPLARQYPDYSAITLPPLPPGNSAPDAKALQGLHLTLFDCLPENISKLPPERRAACALASTGMKHDNAAVDFADHTNRSRYAKHWERGMARRNGPLLLPCASSSGIGISVATLLCLSKGLKEGFDLDDQPLYSDPPANIHVPNGGDPPPLPNQPFH